MALDPGVRQRFLANLDARVGLLRDALEGLESGGEEAPGALRRVAEVVAAAAEPAGFPDLASPAAAVQEASVEELPEAGRRLLDALEEAAGGAGDAVSRGVLVVEDDPEIAHLVEVLLQDAGHAVVCAGTAADARERLDTLVPDLVVVDLVLPDSDGRQLLVGLRERRATAAVPVLVLSARTSDSIREECLALGADAFLEKPLDPERLVAVADELLRAVEQEEREASRDPLSGLLNRAGVLELFEGAGDDVPVAVIEIDGFAAVEAREGAAVAEKVLVAVGSALTEVARESPARAGRWHGPEFALLFPGVDRDAAREATEDVLERIRRVEVRGDDGESFRITASAGLVETEGAELSEAMEAARACVDKARSDGGNRVAEAGRSEADATPSILVAEDDAVTAKLLTHRLRREGYEVTLHDNGADAHEAALERTWDLVILDAAMPGMGGFELLSRLRKVPAYSDVPIVLLTAMGREDDLVRGFDLGADDYVLKPFSPVELAARVRRLLKARGPSRPS